MPTTAKNAPVLEHDLMRRPQLGYEPAGAGLVRCLEHGSPFPLERWHHHDEFEIQLIVATTGRAYVGDFQGRYGPGHLCMTGPRLPHNWVADALPAGGVAQRNLVIHFRDEPLRDAMAGIPELADASGLLQRARRGVEFVGISAEAERLMRLAHARHGLPRLAAFLELMALLAGCEHTRMLAGAPAEGIGLADRADPAPRDRLDRVLRHVQARLRGDCPLAAAAAAAGMSGSAFSRWFGRMTGDTFVAYVNRARIDLACRALMDSDAPVSTIAADAGFRNLAHFNRQFRRIKGKTPGEFRRDARGRFGR